MSLSRAAARGQAGGCASRRAGVRLKKKHMVSASSLVRLPQPEEEQ